MQTRSVGTSDLTLPIIGLGCNNFGWRIDLETSRSVIDAALDAGLRHFDTADIYGDGQSETIIGQVLGSRRADVILATKFGKMPAAKPGVRGTAAYIRSAVEASLARLRTEWIDILYMHEPDPETPIEETLSALDRLRDEGKIHYAAASNFSAAQLRAAAGAAKQLGISGFIATQEEYSLLERGIEEEVAPTAEAAGIGLIPYFPLASGALTGKYRKGRPTPAGSRLSDEATRFSESRWNQIEKLVRFAEAHGHSLLELAMSWLACRPNLASIIAGATSPHQVLANANAVGWHLTTDDLREIDALLTSE